MFYLIRPAIVWGTPIINAGGQEDNFTNEGGYNYTYRFLKNIMGLWMVQSVQNEFNKKYSFLDIERMAAETETVVSIVDVNDSRFLDPKSMIDTIKKVCAEGEQNIPETPGKIMQCLYRNLALSYRGGIVKLEEITGRKFTAINIVGGGSKDNYLNRLTSKLSGLPVYAGPVESTVIGNIYAQMLSDKALTGITEARKLISQSFGIELFN